MRPHRPHRLPLRLAARLTRLRRDEAGVTAIEFALIGPVFLMLVFGIIEVGLVFTGGLVLDNAVAGAARSVRIGQPQGAGTSDGDFRAEVCDRIDFLMSCDPAKLYIDIRTYPGYAAMDLTRPLDATESYAAPTAYGYGGPEDIVIVRAFYKWPTSPIYNGVTLGDLKSGARLLGSFTAFRNEPFPST